LKASKLWTLIEAPIAQIIASAQLLLAIGVGSISYGEEKDVLIFNNKKLTIALTTM
jgi:hypothetical protein